MDEQVRELRILMLEDVPSDAELEEIELRDAGLAYTLLRVETREAFEQAFDEFKPDIVLADFKLPTYNGREALEYTRRTHPQIPVIMVTGVLGDESAVELLKLGARDYVLKDRLARLVPAIRRALSEERGIRNRKLAEAKLRESEEKFHKMSDAAMDAIIMMDAEGKISFWNKAAEKIFGYTSDEALGRELHGLIEPPSRYAEFKQDLEHFFASGEAPAIGKLIELVALKKGGIEFPVELSVSAVQLGGKWNSIGIVRDITERKQAEEKLRETRDYLENLFNHANAPIIVWSPSYRITMFNHAFEHLTGRTADEVIGKQIDILFPAGRKDEALSHIHQTMTGERWEAVEIPIQHASGPVRTVLWNSATLYAADGKTVVATIAQGQDITERKQAEEKLNRAMFDLGERLKELKCMYAVSTLVTNTETPVDQCMQLIVETLPPAMQFPGIACARITLQGRQYTTARFKETSWRLASDIPADGGQAVGAEIFYLEERAVCDEGPFLREEASLINAIARAAGDFLRRKQAEESLRRSNRALKTLSAANLSLVRAASEDELLREVTNVVKQAGYSLAVVDYAGNDPEKSITPMAWSDMDDGQYWAQHLSWADTEHGQLPVSMAIRNGTPQICHDIASHPGFKPWRDDALARGYVTNIALPLSSGGRTFGGLSIYSSDADAFGEEEVRLLEELASGLAYGINALRIRAERDQVMLESRRYLEKIRENLEDTIQAIAVTVEMRDPTTAGHEKHVAELSVAIGRELGLTKEQLDGLLLAGNVFDVGKIRIPAEILNKPGKLDEITFGMIKLHPEMGYEILKGINFPWPVATIVRQHHERLDGSGYPKGLKGGEILLEAQILGVADVVEAMMSHRPYRPSLGLDAALKEIMDNRGKLYNADVVDACVRLFREKGFAFS